LKNSDQQDETTAESPIAIYLRADDFGASPGSNEAIIDAIDCRTIRNVGVMAPGPHLEHCFDALVERQGEACIGMHATLNSEWSNVRWGPVSPAEQVASLVDPDGFFWKQTSQTHERAQLEHITIELEAQLDALRRKGLEPRYIDTHMMFQWIPGVAEIVADLAKREGLVSGVAPSQAYVSLGDGHDWSQDSLAELLEGVRQNAQTGDIWVTHPAHQEAVTEQFGIKVAERRAREARLLIDPQFLKSTQKLGIRLKRFDEA